MLTFSRNELLEQPVAMKKSLFIILAFALISSGCSTVSLIYRNADWFLIHKINDYTSFSSRQKDTIRKEISDYMQWHRKKALPEYIIFLQNLNGAAQYEGRLKAEQVARLRTQFSNLYKKTMVPAIRPAAQLLSELDGRQIQELTETFAGQIQKQRQEFLTSGQTENLDKRAEKTMDFLEWLAGDLSDEQKQQVTKSSRQLPVASYSYIQHREANQARLIALLNGHAGAEKIASFLSSWILAPEATRTPQQQRAIQSFETGMDEMIAQIHGLLTARQKEHIGNLISSYIQEMQKFAAEGQDAADRIGEKSIR
ncbi:MAG: DUF6279 family lipoprotein [Pseudomonadota bacterium]